MDITNYTDEDLTKLLEKYKEKQTRYELMYNEATERNERILFHIEKEIIRRYVDKNLEKFIESKMDIRLD
jgi:23S rRNA maturation-related 3'-5' exoribonuclease YhaM